MFPTPNPRNGLILSPVHQVTILQNHISAILVKWLVHIVVADETLVRF